jgi:photosystem II stability/assembly factor-like uncharacterized protein
MAMGLGAAQARKRAPAGRGLATTVGAAALAVLAAGSGGVFAQERASTAVVDPGTLKAERAPLASRSLLLDVARAGSRFVAVGERGHVLTSDNRGQTWVQAENVPTQVLLTAVCFSDEKRGVVVGHDEIALVTSDGGNSWQRTHYAPEARQPLLDVVCNGSDAIAVGAYGVYFESKDRGVTWTERKFEAESAEVAAARAGASKTSPSAAAADDDEYAAEDLGDYHLNRIVGASGSRLYIAAEAGHLYRSDDAGKTWQEMRSPYEGSFFGLLPLDGETLLAYGLRGHLFRSDDGGNTWRRIPTAGVEAMLNDAVRLPQEGVAIVGLSGALLLSRDGGETFTLQQQADRKGLSAVLPIGATELLTVGEAGIKAIPVEAPKK